MRGGSVWEGKSPAEFPDFGRVRWRGANQTKSSLPCYCCSALGLDVGTVPTTTPRWEARLAGLLPGETDVSREQFMSIQVHIFLFSVFLCNTRSGYGEMVARISCIGFKGTVYFLFSPQGGSSSLQTSGWGLRLLHHLVVIYFPSVLQVFSLRTKDCKEHMRQT